MKAYTDVEQSKKLAEILPIESADMYWLYANGEYFYEVKDGTLDREDIPAWSLAALLDVLPTIDDEFEPQLHRSCGRYRCTYEGEEDSSGLWRVASNPVDACYEMIIKLKENRLV